MLDFNYVWPIAAFTFVGSLYARRRTMLLLVIEPAGFAAISAILVPIVGLPWHPVFQAMPGASITPQRIAVAIWWLLASRLVLLAGRIFHERQADGSRLVFDLASGVVHIGVVIIILSLAFGISVPGLIATSGIIAIVLGLALQNTLGDLFSGIAISIERPFSIGDYIWIEGAMEGVVLETNWRATRIVTDTNDIATVPNSVVAKARILNRSLPTQIRSDVVRLVLDPRVLPQDGVDLLLAATASMAAGMADSWTVLCADIRGEGTSYEIRFLAPRRSLSTVRSSYLFQVARHARYGGVAFATQNGSPQRSVEAPTAAELFEETGLFHGLTDAGFKSMEQKAIVRRGGKKEILIRDDEADCSLFVVARGVFEIILDIEGGPRQIRTLGPGDHVGEVSALTGASQGATVRSLTPFLAYEVTKTDLDSLLRDNPTVMDGFAKAVDNAKRVLAKSSIAKERAEEASSALIDRVKAYLPF